MPPPPPPPQAASVKKGGGSLDFSTSLNHPHHGPLIALQGFVCVCVCVCVCVHAQRESYSTHCCLSILSPLLLLLHRFSCFVFVIIVVVFYQPIGQFFCSKAVKCDKTN